MNQVQVNAKTSVKRANTNFHEPSKKKIATRSTTTSRAILHRSILTEQQVQQQTLPPILSQQHAFPQHNHPQQHALTQQQRDEGEEDSDCDQYQDPSDEKSGSKLARLIKKYESIKKHNNQTEGLVLKQVL
ncbi:hypothetical protein RclHR1_07170016 [Rhizophagus clarus]|uniref:Uncharacterized protein n=1 Tax=Rhizophagus clarus TaxID=94130 RepID=A0A2Z6S7S7_9GLOM|nr:hypothetical protein RclHR1_07170016 [Rhizophagus clarus]